MEKQCKKCLKIKFIEEFYTHKQMVGGHLNFCKECVKSRVKTYYASDLETHRMKERKRNKIRQKNKLYRQKRKEYQKRHRTSEMNKAHNMVRRKLKRPDVCEGCGKICKPEGHHNNYLESLMVIWLCSVCHHKLRNSPILKEVKHGKINT